MNTPEARGGWTDERVELLKLLWAQGHTCEVIAKRMGLPSRSAAIGKVRRLGLARRIDPDATAGRVMPPPRLSGRATKAPASQKTNLHPAGTRVYRVAPDRALPLPPPQDIATAPRVWTERRFGECAYPVSGKGADTLSCCNQCDHPHAVDWSYCAQHKRLMTRGTSTAQWSEEQRAKARARARRMNAERAQQRRDAA